MRKLLFFFFFFGVPCALHSAEVKFNQNVNAQGNALLNVSTFTFRYSDNYTTMSAKLDEIGRSTSALQFTPNNTNYFVLWATQTVTGSKTYQSSSTFNNRISVTSITYQDNSIMTSNTYFYFVSEDTSTTSGTIFTRKLTSTVTIAGIYLVQWSAEVNNDTNGKTAEVRFVAFGSSSNTINTSNFYVNNVVFWTTFSGFVMVENSGRLNYAIEYRQQLGGNARIKNARIFFKKLN